MSKEPGLPPLRANSTRKIAYLALAIIFFVSQVYMVLMWRQLDRFSKHSYEKRPPAAK